MMFKSSDTLQFVRLNKCACFPYELLLLADPSKILVDAYIHQSDVFVATYNDTVYGIIVLLPLDVETFEIKNISVQPPFQKQGIGTFLIRNAIQYAIDNKKKKIIIATAYTSTHQINLYQKIGFKIIAIKKDFFLNNYPEPIYENGMQAKDKIVLSIQL